MPLSIDPSLHSSSHSVSPSPARVTPSGSPGPSPRHTHYRLSIAKTPAASSQQHYPDLSFPPSASSSAASSPSLSPHPPAPLLSRLLRPRTFVQRAVTLAACIVGIYACFLTYAVLQERMSVTALRQPRSLRAARSCYSAGLTEVAGVLAGVVVRSAVQLQETIRRASRAVPARVSHASHNHTRALSGAVVGPCV